MIAASSEAIFVVRVFAPLRHAGLSVMLLATALAVGTSGVCALCADEPDGTSNYQPNEAQINLLAARRNIDWQHVASEDRHRLRAGLAALLTRRNRATAKLMRAAGDDGKAMVDQAIQRWRAELAASGEDAKRQAARWKTTPEAIEAEIRWETLWGDYLRKRLSDDNLKRFFALQPYRYDGTQVDIGQIFIAGDHAKQRLTQIAEEIQSGQTTFAAAAAAHSQAGSATDGGRIGWISAQGDVPVAVANAALAAQPPCLLPIIDSPLGMHLVYVYERRPGKQTFETIDDRRRLRRDATDFLFEHLAAESESKTEPKAE